MHFVYIMKHSYEYDVWMHKKIIIFTDCGKESAKRGGTSGHSTGDESNTFDVSCSKILI